MNYEMVADGGVKRFPSTGQLLSKRSKPGLVGRTALCRQLMSIGFRARSSLFVANAWEEQFLNRKSGRKVTTVIKRTTVVFGGVTRKMCFS